ncbi:MAG: hypothetical protein ACYDH6_23125 [Acidimicrobiales bacterium]
MTLLEERWSTGEDLARGEIALADLRLGPSLRAGGIDPGHVQALKELAGRWPPIVIASAERTVVDGLHRVHAALALGLTRLPCVFFAGDEDDAYAEFVRCNTAHGLPLTFQEREAAAGRLLRSHAEWSDRRIASICALSPGTVARVRAVRARPTAAGEQLDTRVGLDGRSRPVDRRELRARIAEALRANPRASLRGIAAQVGTSPTTVRSVRGELGGGLGVGGADVQAGEDEAWIAAFNQMVDSGAEWAPDAAVLSTEEGAGFADWFTRTAIADEWWAFVGTVPYSRVYEIADEARRRADHWTGFARALEARSRRA